MNAANLDIKPLDRVLGYLEMGVVPSNDTLQRVARLVDSAGETCRDVAAVFASARGGVLPAAELCRSARAQLAMLDAGGEINMPGQVNR